MSFQHENTTPQPTPGRCCDYSQVADNALVVLTDDLTNTECKKIAERACWQEEAEKREREHEAECKAKVETERGGRSTEEEAERQRQRAAVEEAERQRQRAQARQNEAAQRLSGAVYNVNAAQRVPGTSVVVTATKRAPCTHCIEAGREDEEEPETLHKGPPGVGTSSWWAEWEWERQLQAVERYVEAHERAATAFKRMAERWRGAGGWQRAGNGGVE
ncbi:hypothetical protein M404DRAFT_26474 [Pisolithus tinctorius Marx 270]|uniref:Uncharacterized protein n=1 Tax=Pisolithus tinctorius Marx 270 TaxID=870435 RepID=A0A0C3P963_PISTI|nr:hypothetical protein M404DRAFT_26474 [Pisolithus tinctorius Marx 270]